MCGISGYLLPGTTENSASTILRMTRVVAHRGPDDEGLTLILPEASHATVDLLTSESARGAQGRWLEGDGSGAPHRIAFGARRFSIVDLSPTGHQPFWSHDRRICLTFNGEIYNYIELRRELEKQGHVFRTSSDAEVLVESYRRWETGCFELFNGFWALSLYDADKRAVLLARDRFGKAPLYVAETTDRLLWSSEIKGIFAAIGPSAFALRDQAVSDFVTRGWRDVFHETFYQGITSFPSASYAWIGSDGSYRPRRYWELPRQRLGERDIAVDEAIGGFTELLADAVRLRMRADAQVGFELSGGTDSSAITGLAALTGVDLQAFTVSFAGTSSDEEPFARKVAERYRDHVEYTVLRPPEDDLYERFDAYVGVMDEPFHSPSMLTNQVIWRMMAQRGIRVSINGAAGDEVLAGYAGDYFEPYLRFLLCEGHLLRFAREFLRFSERRPGQLGVDGLRFAYHLLPARLRVLRNPATAIRPSIDPFVKPVGVVDLGGPSQRICQRLLDNMGDWQMNYWMRSGNQSSMGVPIEVRMPFLDYRVAELAFVLPVGYLIRDGWLKWVLREAVRDILPPEVVWRKVKAGFPFPLAEWLLKSREPLLAMIGSSDCPFVHLPTLRAAYPRLSRQAPDYLWRILSVALWWKKSVRGERLL
jgi:asparagine synthase (glutamine-hydrolysing)